MKHKKNQFLLLEARNFYHKFFPYFLCFIGKCINFYKAFHDEKGYKLFHLIRNQHLYFLNVGFF